MSNFEVFKCNVCNRQTEKLIDQKRAPISKCNITLKCTGNLVKVSESDIKTLSHQTIEAGLTNWSARGRASNTVVAEAAPLQINLNSSLTSLSMAVPSAVGNEVEVRFEVQRITNTSYVEYFYNRPSNTALISGQDDSAKRLSLRFMNGSDPDRLVVYVNGVELSESGYNRSVSGRIVFNVALADESNQVRVLVFKHDAPSYVTLAFQRNDLASFKANPTSAWSNIETVENPKGVSYAIFTCNDVAGIQLNSRLICRSTTYAASYLLLADAPYSPYDRNLNNAVYMNDVIVANAIIEYKKDEKGIAKFYLNVDKVQSMFPPISILSKISDDVDTNKVNDSNTKLINAFIT